MNAEQVRDLPPVLDVVVAGAVLGIGRTAAYKLVRTDRWPTPVIRVGGRIRIPSAPLLRLVGLDPDSATYVPRSSADAGADPHP